MAIGASNLLARLMIPLLLLREGIHGQTQHYERGRIGSASSVQYVYLMNAVYEFQAPADPLPQPSDDEVQDLIQITQVFYRQMLEDLYPEFQMVACEYLHPFDFDYTRLLVEFQCTITMDSKDEHVLPSAEEVLYDVLNIDRGEYIYDFVHLTYGTLMQYATDVSLQGTTLSTNPPTPSPTYLPTTGPTTKPTEPFPSSSPSHSPSGKPKAHSALPSPLPSLAPLHVQSVPPVPAIPSFSAMPASAPAVLPPVRPTISSVPSVSLAPTSEPTVSSEPTRSARPSQAPSKSAAPTATFAPSPETSVTLRPPITTPPLSLSKAPSNPTIVIIPRKETTDLAAYSSAKLPSMTSSPTTHTSRTSA